MPSSNRLRNFVFTVNNYTQSDHDALLKLPYKYIVFGKEVGGKKGTPHYQGYCELDKQYAFNTIKNMIPRARIRDRKGTAQQAANYCKKDEDYVELGEISHPGKRTDIDSVYRMVQDGKTDIEIGEANPSVYMRYYRAIDRVRMNYARTDNSYRPVKVTVLVGPAGTGKTRQAYEIDPDLYDMTDHNWFDGYHGQKTILIDDFYGTIKYGYLLRLLDGYRFQLPIKGGFTWKQWEHVIITSNDHPRDWYTKGLTAALSRRITEVKMVGVSITPNL